MNAKMKVGMLATMAAMLSDGLSGSSSLKTDSRDVSEKGIKKSVEKSRENYKTLLTQKKGVQKFEIDGKTIYARNLKNAQKKAAKK